MNLRCTEGEGVVEAGDGPGNICRGDGREAHSLFDCLTVVS